MKCVAGIILINGLLTAAACGNPLHRESDPVVLTGMQVRSLNGVAVDRIVGFRFLGSWEQIPIQIDERKYVDFEVVYSRQPSGYGATVYTDAGTHVGPDTDPTLDPDDEIVFMAKDTGDTMPLSAECPEGVLAESLIEIEIGDPLDETTCYVYIFESDGSLASDAGQDYVSYEFNLLEGPYLTHYRRNGGYNPEDSTIHTDAYQTHFSDRWIRDELQILKGAATGVDILDRHKTDRGHGDCSRSEDTASSGGGGFLANKDGCVRAIRSYIGFNSGPWVQRDHFFYQQRHDIDFYWRVHAVPAGGRDVYDYSPEAEGMVYYNDINRDGVLVDGEPDNVILGPLSWEMLTGNQGTLIVCHSVDTDIYQLETSSYYCDDATPELAQCTGDEYEFGVSGLEIGSFPNTDPLLGAFNNLTIHKKIYYQSPNQTVDVATLCYQQSTIPLEAIVTTSIPPLEIFVDDSAPNDPNHGDPNISDPYEDGSLEHPFDAIQEALDYSVDGETVTVLPGTYTGEGNCGLDFRGKAITLRGLDGASNCVIDCQNTDRAFIFHTGEGQDSLLVGFGITNAAADQGGAVYCLNGSGPTIKNCTFWRNMAFGIPGRGVSNAYGGAISCQSSNPNIFNCTFSGNLAGTSGGGFYCEDSSPTLTNCIFWENAPDEVHAAGARVAYCNIQGGWEGEGNIDTDPLYADPEDGDFHLKSQVGRWNPRIAAWAQDEVTSPCIDAGHHDSQPSNEPEPNGNRINMGAFGGTVEASKSP